MITGKEKCFVSAVVYLHDNEGEITGFLRELYRVLHTNFENFEVVCVNDFSSDQTVSVIRDFVAKSERFMLSIINMSYFHGLELSMNAGVDIAIGDFVFEFDSACRDFPPEIIMRIYLRTLEGYDIVSASPDMVRATSKFFYHVFNRNSHSYFKLRTESFRILSRRAVNRAHSISSTLPYRKAIYASSGLKMDFICYKRTAGDVHNTAERNAGARTAQAVETLVLFTDIAYKISLILTLIMVSITLFTGGYTLFVYFGRHAAIAGWTTIMLFLSAAFFGVFLILAIVIKYLSMLMELVFKKQKYFVESIEKITN
ncbi:MAG: glycosyltransferase [Clostridia bacterium]|nr:glycosyltransferase [Clostridia bacterium]